MNNRIKLSIEYEACMSDSRKVSFDIPLDLYRNLARPVMVNTGIEFDVIHKPTSADEIAEIVRERKRISESIALEMTRFIMDQFSANDTVDGYFKSELKKG